jgi:hypothetical protein
MCFLKMVLTAQCNSQQHLIWLSQSNLYRLSGLSTAQTHPLLPGEVIVELPESGSWLANMLLQWPQIELRDEHDCRGHERPKEGHELKSKTLELAIKMQILKEEANKVGCANTL